MPSIDIQDDDLEKLNELIVNCPDFERLEALLGGFNFFQVLKFEHGEIRHSNVLAWILDPSESHGLDATFLKKWLKRIIHESDDNVQTNVAAVDIDCWRLFDVEVRREWNSIDLLLLLNFVGGEQWVVVIENKINSTQHSNQLSRYKTVIERQFPDVTRKLYVFLTKNSEKPEDDGYLSASYEQVHHVLRECVEARRGTVGHEPKVLLENYLRLLEEKFMNESEIARTALRIYQQHRRALDVIFEHRPDNLSLVSGALREHLVNTAEHLGIKIESCTKSYLRFIPKEWDQPGNTHGTAWSGCNRTLIFEINLSGKRPYIYVISGKAPSAWIDPIWKLVGSAPFNRPKRVERPRLWCTLHIAGRTQLSVADVEGSDIAERAQRIYHWCVASLGNQDTKDVIKVLAQELPRLDEMFKATQS